MIGRSIIRTLSTQDPTKTIQTTSGHTSLPWAAFEPSGREVQTRLRLKLRGLIIGYSDCVETDVPFHTKTP
jgi:hypothetical protein